MPMLTTIKDKAVLSVWTTARDAGNLLVNEPHSSKQRGLELCRELQITVMEALPPTEEVPGARME